MVRKIATAFALVLCLSGCQYLPLRHHKSAADFDHALVDQQLMEAARSIERTQAELRSVSAVSTPASLAPAATAKRYTESSGRPVTIDWSGDAVDLARLLAMRDGLGFETRGVKTPLPVSVTAKQLPYSEVMAMLMAQVDNRASVYKLPGKLILEYTPTTGVIR